ncbi:MAG: peptide ABC transporter substrate-binding protein [Phycisphaerales bacterium]|nr:peptide ABC transporter substrate-binding protein [Phycisphaerales bacterium]
MRRIACFALFLVIAWAFLSWERSTPTAEITFSSADVFTMDPQRMSYMQDLRISRSLFEGLCVRNPEGVGCDPGVALAWENSADGKMWTFHLRPDARWSNGDPVTSSDFRDAWRRLLLPDTAADYTELLFSVRGAREFFAWRTKALAEYSAGDHHDEVSAQRLWKDTLAKFSEMVGISTPDATTLVVELENPVPYWLDLCAFPTLAPIHQPSLSAATRVDPTTGFVRSNPGWTKPGVLVSNGPMKLVAWRYKRGMRLEPNEMYVGENTAIAKSVAVVPIEDANTAVLAYESGSIDWISDLTAEFRADLAECSARWLDRHRAEYELRLGAGATVDEALAALPPPEGALGERRDVHVLSAFGTDFWSFNCRPTLSGGRLNPFADARVRRAFAQAVNKESLTKSVTRLNEPIATTLVPRGSIEGYTSPVGLAFDIARARAQLGEAGWIDRNGDGIVENAAGDPFPTVDMLYMTGNPRVKNIAIALAAMWRDGLGVQCELRGKDGKFAKEDLRRGEFMVARGGWYGDYGDPTTFLDLSRTRNGNNDRAFSSAYFDDLLRDAERELDPEKRMAILSEAERFLMEEEMPILPLCQYVTLYMYDPAKMRGITRHPRLDQRLSQLHRVDDARTEDAP